MSKKIIVVFLFLMGSLEASYFPTSTLSSNDIQKIVTFLVSPGNVKGDGTLGNISTSCGVSYTAGNTLLPANTSLPLSFYSSPEYWQYYVGQNSSSYLNVTDVYNYPNGSYNLVPNPSCSTTAPFPVLLCPGNLQIERINAFSGTNIYDASVWQIALALAGKAGFTAPGNQSLFSLLKGQDLLLEQGTYGGDYAGSSPAGVLRAPSQCNGNQDPLFTYGFQKLFIPSGSFTNNKNAYMFRSIPPNFIGTDPIYFLSGTQFIFSDPLNPDPIPSPYFLGAVTWQDFKPITGENGWAFLLGPLQSALLEQQNLGNTFVPFSSTSIQNAINLLPTFQAMQSPIGACYYVAHGSLGNISEVNPYTISSENNFSLLGGLFTLKKILNDELTYETTLSQSEKDQINSVLSSIQVMIYGGLSNGIQTEGLLAFFKNYGWDSANNIFHTTGLANDPIQASSWVLVDTDITAVDVQTWGLSCLGQPLVDSWFGFGTSYNIWQKTKSYGGFYGPDGTLWGVGYSNKDGNGALGSYANGINSGEWTAGAINMLRCLISQYEAVSQISGYTVDQKNQALSYVTSLKQDEQSMSKGILTLSTDNYATNSAYSQFVPAVTSPSNLSYNQLLFNSVTPPSDRLAFMYASKRYAIPFGWNSNPIPSVASTGWVVFNFYNFNPFNPIGTYDANPELNIIPPSFPVLSVEYIETVKDEKVNQVNQLLQ